MCLADIDDVCLAPMPHGRRIRIVAREPSTWAVLTKKGRPTEYKIAGAEIEILDAIARTHWFATGDPIVRIHVPGSIIPMTGRFEVAMPVISRDESSHVAWRDPISHPVHSSSPPVR